MKLNRIVTIAAGSLLATSAFAADVISYEPTPIFSWTGGYVGLNAGYGGGKAKHPFDSWYDDGDAIYRESGSLNLTSSGFLGGAQIGYNYQIGQLVVGIETDIQGANVKGEGSISMSDMDGNSLNARLGTKLDWFGTVRARMGVSATDRFMVYGTGGLAYGRTTSFVRGTSYDAWWDETDSFNESVKKTKGGWTIGAGAEYAITNNVTFKTEYLFTDLGKTNLFSDGGDDYGVSLDRKFNFHTVRAGINYKF